MNTEQTLQSMTDEFQSMFQIVVSNKKIDNFDLWRVVRFLNKVVQVVDQSFEDIYMMLVKFKYLTLNDVQPEKLKELKTELDSLRASTRMRDAEQICVRLHHLERQYEKQIKPIVTQLERPEQWKEMFMLLEEHEGRIIMLVNDAFYEFEQMLNQPLDEDAVRKMNQRASEKARSVHESLKKLWSLREGVLALSDRAGFVTQTDIGERETVILQNIGRNNPWISGSFYLVSMLIVLALVAVIGNMLPIYALPLVFVTGLLAVSIIGALQLKNDNRLKEESFVTLMVETLKHLPLLRLLRARKPKE